MDEVLAFTAFHMSSQYPGSAQVLSRISTELQTRALASFTRLTSATAVDDELTFVPRFLFSAMLGRHVLAEAFTHCNTDFSFFIDRLVEGLKLNQGIRAFTPHRKELEENPETQFFVKATLAAERSIVTPGHECDALKRTMDDSDLNDISLAACRQTIDALQRSFDLCGKLDEEHYPKSVGAFAYRIEAGFIELLRKHRPEALVILAYLGVLLHRCRNFWSFAETGADIVRAVAGQLGSYWQDAIAWPLQAVRTELNTKSDVLALS